MSYTFASTVVPWLLLKKKKAILSLKDASICSFIEQYFLNTYYIPVTFSDY